MNKYGCRGMYTQELCDLADTDAEEMCRLFKFAFPTVPEEDIDNVKSGYSDGFKNGYVKHHEATQKLFSRINELIVDNPDASFLKEIKKLAQEGLELSGIDKQSTGRRVGGHVISTG